MKELTREDFLTELQRYKASYDEDRLKSRQKILDAFDADREYWIRLKPGVGQVDFPDAEPIWKDFRSVCKMLHGARAAMRGKAMRLKDLGFITDTDLEEALGWIDK